ncbi:hypothetical protein NKJ74_05215 [Mesorhizobium sp. M0046]|uniref:hypothetical protein n=1 Tax=Mesorhizobium sp. M0046 TaxID=2956858 RepID=UPI003336B9D4
MAFGHFRHGIGEQRVEKAGLDHPASTRIDLAIHRVVQAAAVGGCIRHHLVFRLPDLAVEPTAREVGVERLLLLPPLLVAFGDGRELVAKTLHRPADRRPFGIGEHIAGIEPALGKLERYGRHLFVSCHERAGDRGAALPRAGPVPPPSSGHEFWRGRQ